ncbi:hypothetical protein [Paracoccus sp. SSK6]|uniref:hypothetical protein n=1 Tax=Paracoccus sp. SSK6 TaxID=3143131 RepID=UPI00321919C0
MLEDLTSAVFGAQDDDELRQIIDDHMTHRPHEMSPEGMAFMQKVQAHLDLLETARSPVPCRYPDGMVPLEFIDWSSDKEPVPSITDDDPVADALAARTDAEAVRIIDRAINASGLISDRKLARRVLECARSPGKVWTDQDMVYAEGVLIRLNEVRT